MYCLKTKIHVDKRFLVPKWARGRLHEPQERLDGPKGCIYRPEGCPHKSEGRLSSIEGRHLGSKGLLFCPEGRLFRPEGYLYSLKTKKNPWKNVFLDEVSQRGAFGVFLVHVSELSGLPGQRPCHSAQNDTGAGEPR